MQDCFHQQYVCIFGSTRFRWTMDWKFKLSLHGFTESFASLARSETLKKHQLRHGPKWHNHRDITSFTLNETNSSHLKIGHPKRKVVFQPSIFRGELLVLGRVSTARLPTKLLPQHSSWFDLKHPTIQGMNLTRCAWHLTSWFYPLQKSPVWSYHLCPRNLVRIKNALRSQ